MDIHQLLYAEAREVRDTAIEEARKHYKRKLTEIDRLLSSLDVEKPPRPRYTVPHTARPSGESLHGMTTIKAAEHVLREGQSLTTVELVIEIQRRWCRSGDDPRKVAKCIRSAFGYHRERFQKDKAGRWCLIVN
ncbi:MAG: hypothetical protein GXP26_13325 [Planctomycetes bacterium]|nr:hypothetical protein [Planctomycetota bacterium]